MTDYQIESPLSDITLICRDDIKLYYSKWLLGANSVVLKAALEEKGCKEISLLDYDSEIIIKVLRWIDKTDATIKTVEHLRLVYEFAHQYQMNKLEADMETSCVTNPSLKLLDSLQVRKSKRYNESLAKFINSPVATTCNPEVTMVHRSIVNDIVQEHQREITEYKKIYTAPKLKTAKKAK
jgi:hypothetical protein